MNYTELRQFLREFSHQSHLIYNREHLHQPLPMRPETKYLVSQQSAPGAVVRYLTLALLLVFSALCAVAAPDAEALQQKLIARFGPARVPLLKSWLQTINSAKSVGDNARLRRINDFVNQNILFDSDAGIWQQSDYWATPLETLGQGAGDCEDFAIIKYVSLRMTGVSDKKLRLIYVKARLETPRGPLQQAHMVLAYYAEPNAEPLILDNLDTNILHASKRTDLHPVFSFNSEAIFAGISGKDKASAGGINRLTRWEDAWRRIRAEGYE